MRGLAWCVCLLSLCMKSLISLASIDNLDRQLDERITCRTLGQLLDQCASLAGELTSKLLCTLDTVALHDQLAGELDITWSGEFTLDQRAQLGVLLPCKERGSGGET